MKACNILGEALKSNNFIRGEKDILIGLVEQMTNGLEKIGFPIEKAVLLQINANQKIEMQANIINFDYWLDELTQLFFVELKKIPAVAVSQQGRKNFSLHQRTFKRKY